MRDLFTWHDLHLNWGGNLGEGVSFTGEYSWEQHPEKEWRLQDCAAGPTGNSKAGMTLQRYPPKSARGPGFYSPTANSHRMWTALGKTLNLKQRNILVEVNFQRDAQPWNISSQYTRWQKACMPWSRRRNRDNMWQDLLVQQLCLWDPHAPYAKFHTIWEQLFQNSG